MRLREEGEKEGGRQGSFKGMCRELLNGLEELQAFLSSAREGELVEEERDLGCPPPLPLLLPIDSNRTVKPSKPLL